MFHSFYRNLAAFAEGQEHAPSEPLIPTILVLSALPPTGFDQTHKLDKARREEYTRVNSGADFSRQMATNKPELASARLVTSTSFTPHASVLRFRRIQEQATSSPPQAYLNVQVDGRVSSYFEWLGAGIYCPGRRATAQSGRQQLLRELQYGFGERFLYLRVDPLPELLHALRDVEFRIKLHGSEDVRMLVGIEDGKFAGCLLDMEDLCILGTHELVQAAFDKILEVAIGRRLLRLTGRMTITLEVEVWTGDLLLDMLPTGGSIEVKLGAGAFGWPAE